jgi:hypothetical protein
VVLLVLLLPPPRPMRNPVRNLPINLRLILKSPIPRINLLLRNLNLQPLLPIPVLDPALVRAQEAVQEAALVPAQKLIQEAALVPAQEAARNLTLEAALVRDPEVDRVPEVVLAQVLAQAQELEPVQLRPVAAVALVRAPEVVLAVDRDLVLAVDLVVVLAVDQVLAVRALALEALVLARAAVLAAALDPVQAVAPALVLTPVKFRWSGVFKRFVRY